MLSQQTIAAVARVCDGMDEDLAAVVMESITSCGTRLKADPEVAARKPYVAPPQLAAPPRPRRSGPPSIDEAARWDEVIAHYDAAAADVAPPAAIEAMWAERAYQFEMQGHALAYERLAEAGLSRAEWRETLDKARERLCKRPRLEGMQSVRDTIGTLQQHPGIWRPRHSFDVVSKTITDLVRTARNYKDKRDRQRRALARWREAGELPSARMCVEMIRRRYVIDRDEDVD